MVTCRTQRGARSELTDTYVELVNSGEGSDKERDRAAAILKMISRRDWSYNTLKMIVNRIDIVSHFGSNAV